MSEAIQQHADHRRSNRALFVGLFLAPLALMANLAFGYMLAAHACNTGFNSALRGLTLAALALALTGAVTAWRRVGATAPEDAGDARARSRFVALMGLGFSALCALVILTLGAAQLVDDPCQSG